jgi:hypothetical protein
VEIPGNWITRLLSSLEGSTGKKFQNRLEFEIWTREVSLPDISYQITTKCCENCFPKPSVQDHGYTNYACFRALTSEYVGIHHIVKKRSTDVKKAVLVLTGSWRWTKPFLGRKNCLDNCKVCPGLPDMDLPHLLTTCKITESVRIRYTTKYTEEVTFENCAKNLSSSENVERTIWILREIYEELVTSISFSGLPGVLAS